MLSGYTLGLTLCWDSGGAAALSLSLAYIIHLGWCAAHCVGLSLGPTRQMDCDNQLCGQPHRDG
eukprot:1194486-Amphidinium_carterae.1